MKRIITALGVVVLLLALGWLLGVLPWRARPESVPWRAKSAGTWQAADERAGLIYRATVIPEIDLTPLIRGETGALAVPISIAIDNNTYERRALPAKILHWSARALDEKHDTFTVATGTLDCVPDDTLAPGARWLRFVSLGIPPMDRYPADWLILVNLGWTDANELMLQIQTKPKTVDRPNGP
ncbi:MAG: hypothetical protein HYV75_07375 [Opitutae bacterium]|nr:hypothetical protein [Opitutae bacterium]